MKVGPDAIHAFKRDPRTSEWFPTQSWDFVVTHPESLHQALMMYTDRDGTPASFRYMNGYGVHTFAMINEQGKRHWVKFHLISEQGTKGLTLDQAKLLAGEDPNFLGRDLREAIARGDFPKWKFCIQIMPEEEGYKVPFAFDPTKVWSHTDYPLIEIGSVVLNRNVTDFHSEVEQVAFSPANIVPGLGFSPDKLLQGRILVYDDTQTHRLGPTFKQIPVNQPKCPLHTMYVGRPGNHETSIKFPHYYPNSFNGYKPDAKYTDPPLKVDGNVGYYDYPGANTDKDWYGQSREFVGVLSSIDFDHMCLNIALSLEKVTSMDVVRKAMQHFAKIDPKLSGTIERIMSDRKTGAVPKTESERVWMDLNKFLGNPLVPMQK